MAEDNQNNPQNEGGQAQGGNNAFAKAAAEAEERRKASGGDTPQVEKSAATSPDKSNEPVPQQKAPESKSSASSSTGANSSGGSTPPSSGASARGASNYEAKLNELLTTTARQNASDLHIAVGRRPTLRIDGALVPLSDQDIITPESAQGLVHALLTEEQKQELEQGRQVDFAYSLEDKARFRVNAYFQKGYLAAALRLIPSRIRTIEELNLPPILHDFTKLSQGFILVVGPAGHGKSTTLAALLDEINHNRTDHIVTIEDPVEYVFTQDRGIISQREVGEDTLTFHDGLRTLLRQDPDVVMIGEMRDKESISTAMTAAETGHLAFSTLHTNSASQTIDRIIDSFPSGQQGQVISQLAATLVAIVSQRLVPRIDGGRIPALEIMIVNPAIRNLIREKKVYQIDLVIETSLQEGMISLNRSLANLVRNKEISMETAELYSLNPSELRILLEKMQ